MPQGHVCISWEYKNTGAPSSRSLITVTGAQWTLLVASSLGLEGLQIEMLCQQVHGVRSDPQPRLLFACHPVSLARHF